MSITKSFTRYNQKNVSKDTKKNLSWCNESEFGEIVGCWKNTNKKSTTKIVV